MVLESVRGKSKRSLARMTGFYLSALAFVFFWLLAFNFQLYAVFAAWFDPVLADTIHFVHDIALATWVWVWGLAMLVQLYRPAKRVLAMQVALLLTVLDLAVSLLAGVFDPAALAFFFGPVFVAAALHPARGELFRFAPSIRTTVDPVLLGLAALAVVPVGLYVVGQLNFQTTLADEHAALDHYAAMGYYGLSIVGLAALASLRNRGRRFPAYAAGLLATMLAVASVFQPTASGLNTTWSALSILWALGVVGAYEWSVWSGSSRLSDRSSEEAEPRASP